jgi:hypothetical protein
MVCKIDNVGSLSFLGLSIAIFRPLHYRGNTQKRRGDVEDRFNSHSSQDVPKAYRIRWESLFLRHFESPVVMKSWWRADETLPPPPTTTTLYSLKNDALDMASWMFSTTGNSTKEKLKPENLVFQAPWAPIGWLAVCNVRRYWVWNCGFGWVGVADQGRSRRTCV